MKQLALLPPMALAASALLLVACGGGGSSSVRPSDPFTSFSAINPPQTVKASGLTAESTYSAPEPDFLVTAIGSIRESETSTANLTYDADGNLTRVSIETPFSTVIWDRSRGDTIDVDEGLILLENSKGTVLGSAVDPVEQDWDYQTFGTWLTGFDNGSGRTGAFSIGAPTPDDRLPARASAMFTGKTVGTYVDPAGESYFTAGDLSVDADFLNRQLDFATTDTAKLNLHTLKESDADNLDLTGTLNYELGKNSFSGSVNGTDLEGTAKGRFYGPNAEELGGYFNLRGSGIEAYRGAFGGSR